MKKRSFLAASIAALFLSAALISSCKVETGRNDYLKKVLANIDNIRSAAYFSTESYSAPDDTVIFLTRHLYVKEYLNRADTSIGSSFAVFQQPDTSKMLWFYDGKSMTYLDWDERTISINRYQNNPLPFKPIMPPFFNYTGSIIKYVLETKDSITTSLKDFGDSIQFRLTIHNKAVGFFGKPYYLNTKYNPLGAKYEIWINKSDNLPYRYIRNTLNDISWISSNNVKLNKSKIEDFTVSEYIPSDFTIPSKENQKTKEVDLVNKTAPDFSIKDGNNSTIALKDLKSKVLLIQFSGIGCGPCHLSIPFLKKLVTDYKDKDFEFVSIETWSKNIDGMKRFHDINKLNYKLLMSTDEVTKSYQVKLVPTFFILDKNRVITKVIKGYFEVTTDKEIKDAINKLI